MSGGACLVLGNGCCWTGGTAPTGLSGEMGAETDDKARVIPRLGADAATGAPETGADITTVSREAGSAEEAQVETFAGMFAGVESYGLFLPLAFSAAAVALSGP